MASDVDRITEVLANHPDWHADAGDLEVVMCRLCEWTKRVSLVDPKGAESAFRAHQAEQLTAAGMGHVPTALHQAADALESASVARRDKELSAGSPVEDMREDRLIRLGIAEATVTIRTIAKTVEAKP